MPTTEHSKWRDFLRPLVEAAVTALAVYAAGARLKSIKYSSSDKTSGLLSNDKD